MSYRFRFAERLLSSPSLPLVRDGRMLRRNMQQELITEDELMAQLRLQGAESVEQVREARMERDGRISVILNESGQHQEPERKIS